jgi:uncharacterized protein (TIGR00730 family)
MPEDAPKQVGPAADAPREGAVAAERKFLQGPQPRGFELRRAWRIFLELMRGFRAFHFVGPCVTVFGSARYGEDSPHYDVARRLGAGLAKEAGGLSIGCNILLPEEQHANRFVDEVVTFEHFYVRKVMLVKYSYAFVALPGGFGTLDETFEIATLIQTKKVHDFPLVLMGKDFWRPLMVFLESLVAAGTVSREDVARILVTDDPDEAVARILEAATGTFGLTYRPAVRPKRWLGEGLLRRRDPFRKYRETDGHGDATGPTE